MFSERYTVIEKYSLTTREKVSTVEAMPKRFTSLADPAYLPDLDTDLKIKLNKYFNYVFDHATDPEYEFNKHLYIEHNDGDIIEILAKEGVRYPVLVPVWNKFSRAIDCEGFMDIRHKIVKHTNVTLSQKTFLLGMLYKPDGTYNGCTIYDDDYSFDGYANQDFLKKVNAFPKYVTKYGYGVLKFKLDTDELSYKLIFNVSHTFDKQDKFVFAVERRNDKAQMYLNVLKKDKLDILTDEEADYITSICTHNSWFDIEFIVNPDGSHKETFVHVHKVDQFEDLTAS